MPFHYEIEGDWDGEVKAYDRPMAPPLKLDDSGPSVQADRILEKQDPVVEDDVRIRQLEAVTQELMRKMKALEEKVIG